MVLVANDIDYIANMLARRHTEFAVTVSLFSEPALAYLHCYICLLAFY